MIGEAGACSWLAWPALTASAVLLASASTNTAWRNTSFRGYADYMETHEFRSALSRLVDAARERRTAVLCSEAVWWRCHRSMIADALKVTGVEVRHILGESKVVAHPYTAPAQIVDGTLRCGPGSG